MKNAPLVISDDWENGWTDKPESKIYDVKNSLNDPMQRSNSN